MSKVTNIYKGKIGYLVGLMVASLIGGLTSAVVMAAIPDANNLIHGCRNNFSGALKVIDSSTQNCNALETNLNWKQSGGNNLAYIHTINDGFGNIHDNPTDSLNVTSTKEVDLNSDGINDYSCYKFTFTPKFYLTSLGNSQSVYVRGLDGANSASSIDSACGTNFDALVALGGTTQYVLFH